MLAQWPELDRQLELKGIKDKFKKGYMQ